MAMHAMQIDEGGAYISEGIIIALSQLKKRGQENEKRKVKKNIDRAEKSKDSKQKEKQRQT